MNFNLLILVTLFLVSSIFNNIISKTYWKCYLAYRAVQETTFDLEGDIHSGTALPASKVLYYDYKLAINKSMCRLNQNYNISSIWGSVANLSVSPAVFPWGWAQILHALLSYIFFFPNLFCLNLYWHWACISCQE